MILRTLPAIAPILRISLICSGLIGFMITGVQAQSNDFGPPKEDTPIVDQPLENDQCTSFSDALSAAYHGDPRIDGARGELERAEANLLAIKAQSKPQITGFVQAGRGDGRLLNNQVDNLAAIQYSQTIFSFGAIKYAKDAARAELRVANARISGVASEVAQEIGAAYLELLRAEALLALSKEQEEFYAKNAASVDDRLRQQVITISEASQIRANYSLATSRRIDADLTRGQARARLESLIGYPLYCISSPAADFYFQDTERYIAQKTLDELLGDSMRLAPDVKRTAARVEAAKALQRQTNRNEYPTISISGFVAREYIPESRRNPFNPITYSDRNRIGLTINQKFYQGGRGEAERRDAAARLTIAQSELENIQRSIADIVRRSWLRVQAQEAARASLAEAKYQLRRQLDETQKEYDIGVRRLDEVIRAADTYFNTAQQEIDIQYQYFNNMFVLRANTLGVVEYRTVP